MQSKLAYTDWGGKRHHSKPLVDVGLLFQAFSKQEALLQNMGAYETTSRSGNPDPGGLATLLPLISSLVDLSSSAEVHSSSIRSALQQLVVHKAEVNNSKYNGNVWVNLRVERIGAVLCHVRALARDPDLLRKAALALTPQYFKDLKGIINRVSVNPTSFLTQSKAEASASAQPSLADADDSCTQYYPEAEPGREMRQLRTHVSDSAMSVDSEGFPNILKSPTKPEEPGAQDSEPSFLRRHLGDKVTQVPGASSTWTKEDTDIDLRVALGYKTEDAGAGALKKAASGSKAKALPKAALPKGKAKAKALPKVKASPKATSSVAKALPPCTLR